MSNGLAVARYLEKSPKVTRVVHPGKAMITLIVFIMYVFVCYLCICIRTHSLLHGNQNCKCSLQQETNEEMNKETKLILIQFIGEKGRMKLACIGAYKIVILRNLYMNVYMHELEKDTERNWDYQQKPLTTLQFHIFLKKFCTTPPSPNNQDVAFTNFSHYSFWFQLMHLDGNRWM